MKRLLPLVVIGACLSVFSSAQGSEPLLSWNEGPAREAIIGFVDRVTDTSSQDYVAPPSRIAVFDNDGTLWSEQPLYFQLRFIIDRVKELAPDHPEWREKQPFKAVLDDDHEALAAAGKKGLMELLMATHAEMTVDQFTDVVEQWLAAARHPRFNRPYTALVYQPMLELLEYLRAHEFKTYIVSGGGIEFMRVFAEKRYGVPPEQVIGSSIRTKFEYRDGEPAIVRIPEMEFIDDKEGKPIAIQKFIGRRPIAAFGNSDGDLQMLQWATVGRKPGLAMIVHHTDGKREWAYDRQSSVGKLDQALTEAEKQGWTLIDMARDWKRIYPDE